MSKLVVWFLGASVAMMLVLFSGHSEAGKELGNGMACRVGSDCQSGNCSFKVCKAKSGSRKALTNGTSCRVGSECESGNCSFKVCKKR